MNKGQIRTKVQDVPALSVISFDMDMAVNMAIGMSPYDKLLDSEIRLGNIFYAISDAVNREIIQEHKYE